MGCLLAVRLWCDGAAAGISLFALRLHVLALRHGALDYLGYGGLGYGGYGGGWYLASQPTVIVLNPGNNGAGAQHGQVVNGRGYVEGGNCLERGPHQLGLVVSGSSSSGGSRCDIVPEQRRRRFGRRPHRGPALSCERLRV